MAFRAQCALQVISSKSEVTTSYQLRHRCQYRCQYMFWMIRCYVQFSICSEFVKHIRSKGYPAQYTVYMIYPDIRCTPPSQITLLILWLTVWPNTSRISFVLSTFHECNVNTYNLQAGCYQECFVHVSKCDSPVPPTIFSSPSELS